MKSGDPQPSDELKHVIATKRGGESPTIEIVSEASRWLKAALKGAGVHYNYAACDEDYYGFSVFTVIRSHRGGLANLEMKIAEIDSRPYVFAEVRSLGRVEGTLFPFFGDLQSDNTRNSLLHYVADFLISTGEPGATG